eukprot:Awhi_evm1s14421
MPRSTAAKPPGNHGSSSVSDEAQKAASFSQPPSVLRNNTTPNPVSVSNLDFPDATLAADIHKTNKPSVALQLDNQTRIPSLDGQNMAYRPRSHSETQMNVFDEELECSETPMESRQRQLRNTSLPPVSNVPNTFYVYQKRDDPRVVLPCVVRPSNFNSNRENFNSGHDIVDHVSENSDQNQHIDIDVDADNWQHQQQNQQQDQQRRQQRRLQQDHQQDHQQDDQQDERHQHQHQHQQQQQQQLQRQQQRSNNGKHRNVNGRHKMMSQSSHGCNSFSGDHLDHSNFNPRRCNSYDAGYHRNDRHDNEDDDDEAFYNTRTISKENQSDQVSRSIRNDIQREQVSRSTTDDDDLCNQVHCDFGPCNNEGCTRRAVYNYPGVKIPKLCEQCMRTWSLKRRKDVDVDMSIKQKTMVFNVCRTRGCNRRKLYNSHHCEQCSLNWKETADLLNIRRSCAVNKCQREVMRDLHGEVVSKYCGNCDEKNEESILNYRGEIGDLRYESAIIGDNGIDKGVQHGEREFKRRPKQAKCQSPLNRHSLERKFIVKEEPNYKQFVNEWKRPKEGEGMMTTESAEYGHRRFQSNWKRSTNTIRTPQEPLLDGKRTKTDDEAKQFVDLFCQASQELLFERYRANTHDQKTTNRGSHVALDISIEKQPINYGGKPPLEKEPIESASIKATTTSSESISGRLENLNLWPRLPVERKPRKYIERAQEALQEMQLSKKKTGIEEKLSPKEKPDSQEKRVSKETTSPKETASKEKAVSQKEVDSKQVVSKDSKEKKKSIVKSCEKAVDSYTERHRQQDLPKNVPNFFL